MIARTSTRRQVIQAAAALGSAPLLARGQAPGAIADPHAGEALGYLVNDYSRLNPTCVAELARPRHAAEVAECLRASTQPVSVGGARFSMGGQIALAHSLHLDMRSMRRVLWLDVPARRLRVQAGASWRDVQAAIDPHGLAVRTMQSFANFSVGGLVSVNCHGRYVGHGAIAHSVLALQLVTTAGDVLELSRERDAELFHAVFGSYGALGVVTEVELTLDANTRITRVVQRVPLHDYPAWFAQQVLANPKALLHNADLSPPDFAQPLAITWVETTAAPTEPARLVPPGAAYRYWGERAALWAMTELPAAGKLREHVINPVRLAGNPVVWRNHECSLDTAMLGANDSVFSTYLLQEYFVPVPQFLRFALAMQQVLTAHGVNAVNVSIRHAPADHSSLLSWAREADVFAFVLYYKQRKGARVDAAERAWTRQLISAALACGGCHYLPYRLLATREQVLAGYPQLPRFARIKRALDPQSRMRNALWDAYLPKTD